MPPFLQFLLRRIFAMLISLVVITLLLYAGVMLTPPEARAQLYLPKGPRAPTQAFIDTVIDSHHLNEPYLVQYGYWMQSLFTGSWGYSPTLKDDVLPVLLHRTPLSLELALYSLVLLIPLGVANGLVAGWYPHRWRDNLFRGTAFFGTSMPPFIFAIMLMAVFYVKLDWLVPGRLDVVTTMEMERSGFRYFTGLLTIDSLLNRRFDILLLAIRHLVMPVVTLSLFHWATLGRVVRATVLGQRNREYIIAARARGVNEKKLVWKHALRAILAPSLTTLAVSAASIVTSVYVVEIIYNLPGVSSVIVESMKGMPDAPAALGFAVYSVLMVMGLILILDVIQAILDPRVRDEVIKI